MFWLPYAWSIDFIITFKFWKLFLLSLTGDSFRKNKKILYIRQKKKKQNVKILTSRDRNLRFSYSHRDRIAIKTIITYSLSLDHSNFRILYTLLIFYPFSGLKSLAIIFSFLYCLRFSNLELFIELYNSNNDRQRRSIAFGLFPISRLVVVHPRII